MRTIRLSVSGMRCRRCVRQATALLRDLKGIVTVTADRSTSRVTVTGDLTDDEVLEALSGTTFEVRIIPSTPSSGTSPPLGLEEQ